MLQPSSSTNTPPANYQQTPPTGSLRTPNTTHAFPLSLVPICITSPYLCCFLRPPFLLNSKLCCPLFSTRSPGLCPYFCPSPHLPECYLPNHSSPVSTYYCQLLPQLFKLLSSLYFMSRWRYLTQNVNCPFSSTVAASTIQYFQQLFVLLSSKKANWSTLVLLTVTKLSM